MKLSELASYVDEKICSDNISLNQYVTTDSMLQNKKGRELAVNLPPVACNLTHYKSGDVLIANIRPYLKKIWYADCDGGCSSDVLAFRVKKGHSSEFLYATLLDDRFFDHAMLGTKGSKMPRGDKDQIMRYEIKSFSIHDETSVGSFAIKNKNLIQLHEQINHNLPIAA